MQKLRASTVQASLVIGLAASFAAPGLAGDARHGAVIAKRWCAACHVVSSDQTSASADAPSFADIARRRPDKKEIAQFLIEPHPPMPNMHLSRKEIDDIVTYIRSLDPRPQPPALEEKDEELPKKG